MSRKAELKGQLTAAKAKIIAMVTKDHNTTGAAKKFKTSPSTIRAYLGKWLSRADYDRLLGKNASCGQLEASKESIVKAFTAGHSINSIAVKYKVGHQKLSRWIQRSVGAELWEKCHHTVRNNGIAIDISKELQAFYARQEQKQADTGIWECQSCFGEFSHPLSRCPKCAGGIVQPKKMALAV